MEFEEWWKKESIEQTSLWSHTRRCDAEKIWYAALKYNADQAVALIKELSGKHFSCTVEREVFLEEWRKKAMSFLNSLPQK